MRLVTYEWGVSVFSYIIRGWVRVIFRQGWDRSLPVEQPGPSESLPTGPPGMFNG